MKKFDFTKLYVSSIFIMMSLLGYGQQVMCDHVDSEFYLNEKYVDYRLQTVRYAVKEDYLGKEAKLFMDVYQPGNFLDDLNASRPVVVLLFGGGFKRGSRNSSRIVTWAEYYTKRGYVVCVPNYRLGWQGADDNVCGTGTTDDFLDAMYRAAQDARTAIDYIKSKSNQWAINSDQVFIHGISAGALAALTWSYNHPVLHDENRLQRLGPLYTEEMDISIKGMISVAGGMLKDFEFKQDAVPLFLIHGSCDGSVPYAEGRLLDCVQYPVFQGSLPIYNKATENDIDCVLNTYCGFQHEFEFSTNNNFQTEKTIDYLLDESVKFIFNQLCENEVSNYQYLANPQLNFTPKDSCRNFEAYEICLPAEKKLDPQIDIVPSHIKFSNAIYVKSIQPVSRIVILEIYDLVGHKLFKSKLSLAEGYTKVAVPPEILNVGLHFVNIFNEDGSERLLCKKILVEGSLLTY